MSFVRWLPFVLFSFAQFNTLAETTSPVTTLTAPVAPAAVTPPPPKSDWTYALSSRVRHENGTQFNLRDRKDYSSIRLRALVTFTGFEGVKVVAEPQYNKLWGQSPYVGTSTGANEAIVSSGNQQYTGNLDSLTFRSAYLDWSVRPGLNLLLGRQVIQYGDAVIIGVNDWSVHARPFDAARLRYVWRSVNVEAFRAKIVDTQNTKAQLGEDKVLDGIYVTYAPGFFVRGIEAYNFWVDDKQKQTDPDDKTRPWKFGVTGGRLLLGKGDWSARAEYGKNFGPPERNPAEYGKNNAVFTARTDYQFQGRYAQKPGLEVFYAGENWRELFPGPFEAMGRTDVLGRRNVEGAAFHLTSNFGETLVTGVDLFYFRRVGQGTTVFQPDGKTKIGVLGPKSMDLGWELDVTGRYALTKQMNLGVGASILWAGRYLEESEGKNKTPTFIYAMLELRQ